MKKLIYFVIIVAVFACGILYYYNNYVNKKTVTDGTFVDSNMENEI